MIHTMRRGNFLAFLLLLWHTAHGFMRACNSGRSAVAMAAKGKKGKKAKKQPKQSGIEWAKSFEVMPYDSSVLRPLASDAASAFEGRTGKPLDESLVGVSEMPKALYKAPICVMVVSGEKITYANDAACEFAGKKHTELIGSATVLPATVADGYDSSYEKKVDGRTMQKAKRWSISKMAVVDGELVTEDQGVCLGVLREAMVWSSYANEATRHSPSAFRAGRLRLQRLDTRRGRRAL